MKRYAKQIALGVLEALGIFVLLALVFVAYGCTDNRWYRVLIVRSGSMTPVFYTGDLIVIGHYDPEATLSPGTIITFKVKGRIVTHRIVAVADDGYVTKGDANNVADTWENSPGETYNIDSSAIIGVYRGRIPGLGYGASWLFGFPSSPESGISMGSDAEFTDSKTFMETFRTGSWATPTPTPTLAPGDEAGSGGERFGEPTPMPPSAFPQDWPSDGGQEDGYYGE